jgi:hypothetical protein
MRLKYVFMAYIKHQFYGAILNTAQFPRLLVRQQQRVFVNPNHKQ